MRKFDLADGLVVAGLLMIGGGLCVVVSPGVAAVVVGAILFGLGYQGSR